MLPFTHAELMRAVLDGDVTERKHPTLPLFIYNYSPSVQFENKWNEVTLNCRGLILDEHGNIVARPWRKFFNLGQVELPIQFDTPVEVMDKADGSLGILYPSGDVWAIATRGSFSSEQAIKGTNIFWDNYIEYYNDAPERWLLDRYTMLFEIIYPSNRIVLDYGDMTDLILLGAVENETGYYVGARAAANMFAWPGPVVETFEYNTLSDAMSHMERPNAEGFVIRSHNFMVKLKQPDYLELHRLVTNASPKTVWEQLKAGKSRSEIISAFPDEFHDYIGGMIDPLLDAYEVRLEEIMENFYRATAAAQNKYGLNCERKSFAQEFSGWDDVKYFFLLLDNRPLRDVLWTELKPKEAKV